MGKKNKKKGGKAARAARKERLQERREQQLVGLDDRREDRREERREDHHEKHHEDHHEDPHEDPHEEQHVEPTREFFEGDRVWFREGSTWGDGTNPNNYRGYVKRVRGDSLDIVPLQSKIEGTDDSVRVQLDRDGHFVFPDFCDFTLRFEVGERVLRRCEGGWKRKEVRLLWPILEIFCQDKPVPQGPGDSVPAYKCYNEAEEGILAAPSDDDSCIKRSPGRPFRLEAGDRVVFDSRKARIVGEKARIVGGANRSSSAEDPLLDPWLEGTVDLVDVTYRESYFAYECVSKMSLFHVLWDDDEHIAKSDADPRERLLEAVEQRCSRDHLRYLAETFQIDVSTFWDLFIQKLLQFASYHTLAWLKFDCGVEVLQIKDAEGNSILHKVAASPYVASFVREARRMKDAEEDSADYEWLLTSDLNDGGETWLQIIVQRGDTKALDTVLSPHVGWAWDLSCDRHFPEDQRAMLEGSIAEAGNVVMKCIFDSFLAFRELKNQFDLFLFHFGKSEDELLESQEVFQGEGAQHHAKRLARFILDWEGSSDELSCNPLLQLVERGFFKMFKLFYEANESMFLQKSYRVWSKEDRGDYIQPELAPILEEHSPYDCMNVDILMACIIGAGGPDSSGSRLHRWEQDCYLRSVEEHYVSYDHTHCPSWHAHLKGMMQHESSGHSHSYKDYLAKRIRVLDDEDNLQGRLQILEFLLQRRNVKIDILEVIRHRQCGVLRFMSDKGLLKLQANALSYLEFKKHAEELRFLDGGRIPNSMSTHSFLCFAAVQYDDLQSLQWLCGLTPLLSESCNGWNILHFSAFMGRVEIIGWLSTQPAWQSLVSGVCWRNPFQNAYALHIAVTQGHLFAAELMLALEVPEEDNMRKMPEHWAKKSQHGFVNDWAKERSKPLALERDIKKLLHLVDASDTARLKDFIVKSKCLDLEVWQYCDYKCFHTKGPLGHSFEDVLKICCSNRSLDPDFVLWLLARLYFGRDYSFGATFWHHPKGGHDKNQHSVRKMDRDDLIAFAENEGYWDLAGYLQKEFCRDISCIDPVTKNSLLKSAISEGENGQFLLEIRAKILRVAVLVEIINLSITITRDHLKRGVSPEVLDEVFRVGSVVKKTLIDEGYDSGFDEIRSFMLHPTDMSTSTLANYDDHHSLLKQLTFVSRTRRDLTAPHIVLATEGFSKLLEYVLRNWKGWTATMEVETTRIAAFYGHASILDIFLTADSVFVSDVSDRTQAAIIGAGEACRCRELARLLASYGSVSDPIKEERPPVYDSKREDHDTYWRRSGTYMAQSLVCGVINAYIRETYDSNVDDKKEMKTLKLIVKKLGYTHGEILHAIELLHKRGGWSRKWTATVVDILQSIIGALQLQPLMHCSQMNFICREVVKVCIERTREGDPDVEMAIDRVVLSWLKEMAWCGVPIDKYVSSSIACFNETNPFSDEYRKIEQGQRWLWSQFDHVKNGQSIEEIQSAIEEGTLGIDSRDRGGSSLTHISAAYGRVDLLEWLVVTKKMDLFSKDGKGRTALEVARAAKATGTSQWILEFEAKRTIAAFIKQNFHRIVAMRNQKRLIAAASTIQKYFRGHLIRRLYSGILLHRLEESHRFCAVWGDLIDVSIDLEGVSSNWSSIREKTLDIQHLGFAYDDEYFEDTDEQLSRALEGALQVDDEAVELGYEDNGVLPAAQKECLGIGKGMESRNTSWLKFQMTSYVIKFLKRGDPKYKAFFVRRLQQLAAGERSRILQKRLKGSDSTIYETYLEQKSGFRILWTEDGENIIIWFVAKHKEVSRLMKLIDDSKSRTARQQLPETLVAELRNDSLLPQAKRKQVLLDPFGNVPMKLYDFFRNDIDDIKMKSWTPRLHLTEEERDVVEAEGTVLVLGRSGTGKTVCICNRMEYDRQRYYLDQTFSQLFVARSKRLCRYVAEVTYNQDSCHTFEDLLHEMDTFLPRLENNDKHFFPSQRVDYQRFKQEFYNLHFPKDKKTGTSALYVWTAIRTFINGSVEAFQSPCGVLSREDFIVVEKLGKNRCRIHADLREGIYDVFLKYQAYKQQLGLWDDCDRIQHLLLRLEGSKTTDPSALDQVRRSKIYVDEIQDYTQIECLLFFYLGGPGGLFLAGDPAQSVVEGTEFRFEEIRSLGHFVAGNGSYRSRIPRKPKIVNVNFRSHAGILNCASAFLDFLFHYFPGSVRRLRADIGLFAGSRPGLLQSVDLKHLKTLISDKLKGTVILCHDESARHWQHALGGYQLVYGIREAKGLEFRSVILLDFFRELPAAFQKPWRDMLLDRAGADFETKHPLVGTHLKLLYTGITRCIERLLFVETLNSVAGDAVVRWLSSVDSGKQRTTQGNALATRNKINDIEAMAMTSDEFLSRGFDDAEMAESRNIDLEVAVASLDRAVFCFEQADNLSLAAKARTHRRSIQLRIDLASKQDEMSTNDKAVAEMASAQLMVSLVKEGLMFEVMNLFYSISPALSSYAKEKLEKSFISKTCITNSKSNMVN